MKLDQITSAFICTALILCSCQNDDDSMASVPKAPQLSESEQVILATAEWYNDGDEVSDDKIELLQSYQLENNGLQLKHVFLNPEKSITKNDDTAVFENIKAVVAKAIPTEATKYLDRIVFVSGIPELGGFIDRSTKDLSKMNIFLNVDNNLYEGEISKDDELTNTVVHELMHVLTINAGQIDRSIKSETACQNYLMDQDEDIVFGCTLDTAYLSSFIKEYWNPFKFDLYEEEDANYVEHQDKFVTEYAATNPREDIAETLVSFIFSEEKPLDDNSIVADKKTASFYDYPELKNIRDLIRKANPNVKLPAKEVYAAKSLKARKKRCLHHR